MVMHSVQATSFGRWLQSPSRSLVREGAQPPSKESRDSFRPVFFKLGCAGGGQVPSACCKSAPDNAQRSDYWQGKINSNKSPDCGPGHQREDGEKRMDLEFMPHHAGRDP